MGFIVVDNNAPDSPTPNHIQRLRSQSLYGRTIETHRAIRSLDFPKNRWFDVFLIPIGFNLLTILLYPAISRVWHGIMEWFLIDLISNLSFAKQEVWFSDIGVAVPQIPSQIPSIQQWWIGMVFSITFILLPKFISKKLTPFRYFAICIGLIQFSAQVFFLYMLGLFPYGASAYLGSMLECSFSLILATPWLLAAVYNIFPFHTARKIALSGLTIGVMLMAVPIQYAFQTWILHTGSMLWMPILYFLGGMPFSVLALICLYSWAMTWQSLEDTARS